MIKIYINYVDAGFGHIKTAQRLKQLLESQINCEVIIDNLYNLKIKKYDVCYRLFGISWVDIYNRFILRYRWSRIFQPFYAAAVALNILFFHSLGKKRFVEYWQKIRPDLVISVSPFFNFLIVSSLKYYDSKIPFVTLMTDLKEAYPGMWRVARNKPVICMTHCGYEHFFRKNHDLAQLYCLDGGIMPLNFYEKVNKEEIYQKYNLDSNKLTMLVLFGGKNSANLMINIAKELQKVKKNIQVIFICGCNVKIQKKIKNLKTNYSKCVLGHIENLKEFYSIVDLFVGKPGPGCMLEAAFFNVPLLLELNWLTLIQERPNAKWAEKNGYGLTFSNKRDFLKNFELMIQDHNLKQYKRNLKKFQQKGNDRIIEYIKEIISH